MKKVICDHIEDCPAPCREHGKPHKKEKHCGVELCAQIYGTCGCVEVKDGE